jgi:hypothetical protein
MIITLSLLLEFPNISIACQSNVDVNNLTGEEISQCVLNFFAKYICLVVAVGALVRHCWSRFLKAIDMFI